ncbi:(endo)-chitinase [Vairimorpha necatrix]
MKNNKISCTTNTKEKSKQSKGTEKNIMEQLIKLSHDKDFVNSLKKHLEQDNEEDVESNENKESEDYDSENEQEESEIKEKSHKNKRKKEQEDSDNKDKSNKKKSDQEESEIEEKSHKKKKKDSNKEKKSTKKRESKKKKYKKVKSNHSKSDKQNDKEDNHVVTVTYYKGQDAQHRDKTVTVYKTIIQKENASNIDVQLIQPSDKSVKPYVKPQDIQKNGITSSELAGNMPATQGGGQLGAAQGGGGQAAGTANGNVPGGATQGAGAAGAAQHGGGQAGGATQGGNTGGAAQGGGTGGASAQKPAQGGGGAAQKPAQSGGGGAQKPAQSGGGGAQKPAQSGGGGAQKPAQGGAGASKPSQGAGAQKPAQGGSAQKPTQGGGDKKSAQGGGAGGDKKPTEGGAQKPAQGGGAGGDKKPSESGGDKKPSGSGGGNGEVNVSADQINEAMSKQSFSPNPEYVEAVVKATNENFDDLNMAAMFIAQLAHESGGFQYIEEIDCAGSTSCADQYGGSEGAPGKSYHGRGFIQLSWPANYKAAGESLGMGDELFQNPEKVAEDAELGAKVSVWFWKENVESAPGVKDNQFGATTKAINGALECTGSNVDKSKKRYEIYKAVAEVLGISNLADEGGCY